MANLKKTLDSGAVLEVTMSDFEPSYNLFKAVMRETEGINITDKDNIINVIKNFAARIIYSEVIQAALWTCMERATYDHKKVCKELFEDEKIRGDYLVVVKEVMVYNLSPFLKSLKFQSSEQLLKYIDILK